MKIPVESVSSRVLLYICFLMAFIQGKSHGTGSKTVSLKAGAPYGKHLN